MNTESGGNPTIVNKWDSNWKAGHPSVGLMQVIQGTFDAFAGPFRNIGPFLYGVSTNPLANIFAGLNYAVHTYPDWTAVLGHGHGYDRGGWLKPGWALNMTRGREAVLTPDQSSAFVGLAEYARQLKNSAGSRAAGLMRDVHIQLPEGATVARALSDLTFKLSTLTQEAGVMTP
jgi:SLT domain-containing protein